MIGDATQGVDQNATRHAQADEPAEGIEQGDQQENTPGENAKALTDEIPRCKAMREQALDTLCQWCEEQQAYGTKRIANHAPDAQLIGHLRCRHSGI